MTESKSITLLILVGTRPEAIKMAPVVLEARRRSGVQAVLCATAQHRHLMDDALETFGLKPDFDLDLMRPDQGLTGLAAGIFEKLPPVLAQVQPHAVLVQGDTTTAFAGAVAAFYAGIAVGHVEAGLRTGDLAAPFPEEGNRKMISAIAHWHFAPTDGAAAHLAREGVPAERVHVTGNTIIDALHIVERRLGEAAPPGPFILVTGHRRESFGEGMRAVCDALAELARRRPKFRIVYPVHPNPNVRGPVEAVLGGQPNIELIAPLNYENFVRHLKHCRFVITDSGGVQEEAPAFGKPVLVTRTVTERPEAVAAGSARLVGTDRNLILETAEALLQDSDLFRQMSHSRTPFGDGHAAERILDVLSEGGALVTSHQQARIRGK